MRHDAIALLSSLLFVADAPFGRMMHPAAATMPAVNNPAALHQPVLMPRLSPPLCRSAVDVGRLGHCPLCVPGAPDTHHPSKVPFGTLPPHELTNDPSRMTASCCMSEDVADRRALQWTADGKRTDGYKCRGTSEDQVGLI